MEKENYAKDLFKEFFSGERVDLSAKSKIDKKTDIENSLYEKNMQELLEQKMLKEDTKKQKLLSALGDATFNGEKYNELMKELRQLQSNIEFVKDGYVEIYKQQRGVDKKIVRFAQLISLPNLMIQFTFPMNPLIHLVLGIFICYTIFKDIYTTIKGQKEQEKIEMVLTNDIKERKIEIMSQFDMFSIYHSLKFYSKEQQEEWVKENLLNEVNKNQNEKTIEHIKLADIASKDLSSDKVISGFSNLIQLMQNRLDSEALVLYSKKNEKDEKDNNFIEIMKSMSK